MYGFNDTRDVYLREWRIKSPLASMQCNIFEDKRLSCDKIKIQLSFTPEKKNNTTVLPKLIMFAL